MIIKPQVSDLIEHRLPDWMLDKPQFVNFIKYYYEWLEQKGNPLEFLRNIVEYGDVDDTTDEFLELIINKVVSFIPADAVIDRKLMVKNVKAFLRSKGTDESLNFIMKAVYNEEAYRVNMTDYVLRSSDNEYNQDGYISLQVVDSSKDDFSLCYGSTLSQLDYPASIKVENATYHVSDDGRQFFVVKFDPRYMNGEFNIGSNVRAMKRSADPTFLEITEYATSPGFDIGTNVIRMVSNNRMSFYAGQLVLSLDGGFRGVVEDVEQYFINSYNQHDYNIILSEFSTPNILSFDFVGSIDDNILTVTSVSGGILNTNQIITGEFIATGTYITEKVTGTGAAGTYKVSVSQSIPSSNLISVKTITPGEEVYLCASANENRHITKNDYVYGKVDQCIGNFITPTPASGYYENAPLEIRGGSGGGCTGFVGEISTGGVDRVIVLEGGSAYKIGDEVQLADTSSGGFGFSAYVSNVDGFGAELKPVMQIDSLIVNSGGYGYVVGDTLKVNGLHNELGSEITLTVATVANESTATLKSFKILNSGKGYRNAIPTLVPYSELTVVDGVITDADPAITPITGLYVDYFTPLNEPYEKYSINASKNNFQDSIIDVKIKTAPTPSVLLGANSGNGDTNAYLVFNGFGCFATATLSSGTIASIAVPKSGYAYVDPVVYITDPTGRGASARATKDASGRITAITVLTVGENYTAPSVSVYDRNGHGFIAQALCINTTLGAITSFSGLSSDGRGEFLSLPESSENISYTPISVKGNAAKISITYRVKSLNIENQGSGYLVPFTVYGCSSTNGTNVIATTENFSKVQVGMYVSGANIPTRTRVLSITLISSVAAEIVVSNNVTGNNASVTFDPNVVVSTGGIGSGLELFPVIVSGQLENVVVVNAGENYPFNSVIEFTGGTTQASANVTVSQGKVAIIDMITYGTGYTENNFGFIMNPSSANSFQHEADVSATISGTGEIMAVTVVDGGRGYTNDGTTKIYIEGSFLTEADLSPVVYTGVDILLVENIGTEGAFSVSLSDNWKNVIDPLGNPRTVLYKTTNILDTGSGVNGVLSYFVENTGKLATYGGQAWMWISNGGSDYTAPYISWSGILPKIKLGCSRKIEKVTIVDGGTGYDSGTQLTLVGTGSGCTLTPMIDGGSGISSVTLLATANTNKGYTKYPTMIVEDYSYFGKISEVTVKNPGSGFRTFPLLKCELYNTVTTEESYGGAVTRVIKYTGVSNDRPNPAMGAKLLAVSNTIGAVKKINQNTFGYGYKEIPEVMYPVVLLLKNANNFKLNEFVSHSAAATSNLGLFFSKIESFGELNESNVLVGTSTVKITFNDRPSSYGVYEGQTMTFTALTNRINEAVAGKSFTVLSSNKNENSVIAYTNANIPVGEYSLLLSPMANDVVLAYKSAKVIKIDRARNLMWLSNVDNVYNYTEDIGYIAEGGISDADDGKIIVTENFSQISETQTLIGHKSGASSEILWSNRAFSLPVQTSIGKTKKYFTSSRGMLNNKDIRMVNSQNVQDFSYEVHTGYSTDVYSKLLKETVHPAGYHLSGVVEDFTDTTLYLENILNVDLPVTESGATGDFVYLSLLGTLASLFVLQNYKTFESTKERYKHRLSENIQVLAYSFPVIDGEIQSFDLWTYPEYNIWHNKSETDESDYTVWGPNALTAEMDISKNIISTCTYAQVGTVLTVTATSHGLKSGDAFKILFANKYVNKGHFSRYAEKEYFLDDIVLYLGKWYKCNVASFVSMGNQYAMTQEPSTDVAHWTLCEGNISEQSFIVESVLGVNSFTVTMPYAISHTEAIAKPYYKTYTEFTQGTYTRSGNTVTVTSSNHGLVSGHHSNIFGYFDAADSSFTANYTVTGTTTTVSIAYNNHGYVTGDYTNLKFLVDNDNPAVDVNDNLVTPYYTPNNGYYAITKIDNNTFTITNGSSLTNISGLVVLLDKKECIGKYFNVSVINTNSFSFNTASVGKSDPSLDHFYWVKAENTLPKIDRQICVRNVTFNISGLNIQITGIDGHSLQVGNIIMLTVGSNNFFSKVESKTTSSITAKNTGVQNGNVVDLVYSFDQFDSPESTYRSLTTNVYPNFL